MTDERITRPDAITPVVGRPNLALAFTREVRAVFPRWEGWGEIPGVNNSSPQIDQLRGIDGTTFGPGGAGSWCAVPPSAAVTTVAVEHNWHRPFAGNRGAKKLVKNCGGAGGFLVAPRGWILKGRYYGPLDPDALRRMLLIGWHRGNNSKDSYKGHVETIRVEEGAPGYDPETDTLFTWAGNVSLTTAARVDLHRRLGLEIHPGQAVIHRRIHANGAWRERLYAIAGLVAP